MSDDGVRLWVNGVQVINNWTLHSATTNTSNSINLAANTRYAIEMEFYEQTGMRGREAPVAPAEQLELRDGPA